jgi:hypothetical protein
VLRPVLASGLPSWATGLTWVISRVNYLALTAPSVSEFTSLRAVTALPFVKIINKIYISAISPNLKEKKLHFRLKPKNTRVAWRYTPKTNGTWGLKKRRSSVDIPATLEVYVCIWTFYI